MVLACALFAVLAAPAGAQLALKPDLVVSSAAEPPDFIATEDGGDFLNSFTVDNQGRRRARVVTTARAYLSLGRVMSADDRRRRVGSRRVKPLGRNQSITRRLIVRIPAEFRQGEYFLIVCADVRNQVDEINDRANCHVSGQKLRIAPEAARQGPPGPRGEPGPPGPGADIVRLGRKTLDLGTATVTGKPGYGPGDNEGSTQQFDLGEVGGVRIRASCVSTTNGDNELPGDDDDGDGFLGVDNDFNTDEDGDEAKILLYMDRPEGNFSFSGPHGKRFNINAGFGRTTTSIEDPNDDDGGDGKHMALATAADPESRIAGDADDTDNTVGEDTTAPVNEPEDDWEHAFRSGSIYVATSTGTEFILNAYAGVGVLGSRADQCTFGGTVTVVNR
jgi:hypothetical protein